MKFLALVTSYEGAEGVIHASILDPKSLRGTAITFPSSKVHKEEEWQRPFLPRTSILVGDFLGGGAVGNVKLLPRQQFRGIIQDWDPIQMQATVEYPEIQEIHSHQFNNPWLVRGDRIIVEGNFSGLEWSVGDFRLHRRVRTCKLEIGTITARNGECGYLRSISNDDLEFDCKDVLLCDGRDFYPESLRSIGYQPELENTFEVGEQVFFIKVQGEDLERCTIRVFVPETEYGLMDPIFELAHSGLRSSFAGRADIAKSSSRGCCNRTLYEEAPPFALRPKRLESRTSLGDNQFGSSCPDIHAYCSR